MCLWDGGGASGGSAQHCCLSSRTIIVAAWVLLSLLSLLRPLLLLPPPPRLPSTCLCPSAALQRPTTFFDDEWRCPVRVRDIIRVVQTLIAKQGELQHR